MALTWTTTTTCTPPARSCCGDSIEPAKPSARTSGPWTSFTRTRSAASSSGDGTSSDPGDRLQLAAVDGARKLLVVGVILISVRLGEVAHRAIERLTLAEVGRDRDPVARPGVGPGQCPAAEPRVDVHGLRVHRLDLGRALAVPELADVEVALLAIGAFGRE